MKLWMIVGIILLVILLILVLLYIYGRSLEREYEEFDNPLDAKTDMIDKLYAKIYNKVFDEPEVFKEEAKEILKFMDKHEIEGGEIFGNWLTGRLNRATAPHKVIINEITVAKIGRRNKAFKYII